MELLDRIFYSASAEHACLGPDEGLYALYWRSESTKRSDDLMQKALEDVGLSMAQQEQVSSVWAQTRTEDERQGFLNGFRFGMMMAQELAGTEGRTQGMQVRR